MEKSNSQVPSSGSSLLEPKAAGNTCAHAGRTLQHRSACTVTAIQTRDYSNSYSAIITFSNGFSAPRRKQDDETSSWQLCLAPACPIA